MRLQPAPLSACCCEPLRPALPRSALAAVTAALQQVPGVTAEQADTLATTLAEVPSALAKAPDGLQSAVDFLTTTINQVKAPGQRAAARPAAALHRTRGASGGLPGLADRAADPVAGTWLATLPAAPLLCQVGSSVQAMGTLFQHGGAAQRMAHSVPTPPHL